LKSLICNLKMNHSLKEMLEYKSILEQSSISSFFLCPSFCYLPVMHSKKYQLCAQNVSIQDVENLTGAVSISALKSLDVHAVLIGHNDLNESFQEILEKVKFVTSHNSHAFVILSDTKEEFDYQYTSVVIYEKIKKILEEVSKDRYFLLTFIYEPSWLIGGGEAMNIEVIQNIFYKVKMELYQEFSIHFPLFYGGGLTMENISSFLSSSNIDGLLLGSLSNNAKNVVKLLQSNDFSTKLDKSIHQ